MGVDHSTLDIINVSVVFESSLQKSCLLTELGNVGLVIVSKHLVAHDSIGYLEVVHQVMRRIEECVRQKECVCV